MDTRVVDYSTPTSPSIYKKFRLGDMTRRRKVCVSCGYRVSTLEIRVDYLKPILRMALASRRLVVVIREFMSMEDTIREK